MDTAQFIQVILPLRLDWEPFYRCASPLQVGDRVRVPFSGREYIGVVSAVGVPPSVERVLSVREEATGMERILPGEIAFWRSLSAYYLCPVGEIYRAAYPLTASSGEERAAQRQKRREEREAAMREKIRQRLETLRQRLSTTEAALAAVRPGTKRQAALQETVIRLKAQMAAAESALSAVSPSGKSPDAGGEPARAAAHADSQDRSQTLLPAMQSVREAFRQGRTVLLSGGDAAGRTAVYRTLVRETLSRRPSSGRNVLWLFPDAASARAEAETTGALLYDPSLSMAARRAVAEAVRHTDGYCVVGTRMALLLPHRDLGLVVVEGEHGRAYKMESAPRYHARDAALILSRQHGASAILGSATPSLESLYNAGCGRYARVSLPVRPCPVEIVDTSAEKRKRGMRGELSLKMLDAIRLALREGQSVCVLTIWKDPEHQIAAALEETFPEAGAALTCCPLGDWPGDRRSYGLICLMHGEALLSREDFRADERAFQVLRALVQAAPLFVQAKGAEHPVFRTLQQGTDDTAFLMQEREALGYPPLTRMIRLVIKDPAQKRLDYMSSRLADSLRSLPGRPRLTGPYAPPTDSDARHLVLLLPRTAGASGTKRAVLQAVAAWEKEGRYPGHIHIDVDPAG